MSKHKDNSIANFKRGTTEMVILSLLSDEAGYISNYIKQVGTKRTRRYYHIEDKGKRYLSKIVNEYSMVCESVNQILKKE